MYVVIDQSPPLPISIFLSLCLLFYLQIIISNQLAYMQACMVCICMRVFIQVCTNGKMGSRCAVVTRTETPSYGSVGWKPLAWVCHVLYYFPIETRENSYRSPICRGVHMYVSTHVYTWVHLHACVWVGLVKLYGLRGSTEVKQEYRIHIVKWMCATRDWVCVRT